MQYFGIPQGGAGEQDNKITALKKNKTYENPGESYQILQNKVKLYKWLFKITLEKKSYNYIPSLSPFATSFSCIN